MGRTFSVLCFFSLVYTVLPQAIQNLDKIWLGRGWGVGAENILLGKNGLVGKGEFEL